MWHSISRALYNITTLLLAWLMMQAVHEAGHVLAGLIVGDRVERVVLHPLTISRTDLTPGHNLLFTTAAGPIVGVVLPLAAWGLCVALRTPLRHWLRFFAGFCLIANGAYLGMAMIEPVGDTEVLLQHGAPTWALGLFGLATVPIGLRLWHGLGPEFGWGPKGRTITWRDATIVMLCLALVIALEMM